MIEKIEEGKRREKTQSKYDSKIGQNKNIKHLI